MGELIEMPGQVGSKREDLFKALAGLVNVATLVVLVASVPVIWWLWTVAL
jgi:hypothetical protein